MIPQRRNGDPGTPTARELNALLAMAEHGDGAVAAAAVGIAHQTLKNLIASLCRKVGATSSLQAYYLLSEARLEPRDPIVTSEWSYASGPVTSTDFRDEPDA